MQASACHKTIRHYSQIKPGRLPSMLLTLPKPQIERGFLRAFVLGKPDIAIDAKDRTIHPRFGIN